MSDTPANAPAFAEEIMLLAEKLGELNERLAKAEADLATQTAPLDATKAAQDATLAALSAALSGIKALNFHVLGNDLGAVSKRVESVENLQKAEAVELATMIGRVRERLDEAVAATEKKLAALESGRTEFAQKRDADAQALSAKADRAELQQAVGALSAELAKARTEFAAMPKSFAPRGEWEADVKYDKLDVVTVNGTSYVSRVSGNLEKPGKMSRAWQVLARRASAMVVGGTVDDTNVLKWGDLSTPYMIAHKGGSFVAPENTLEAFRYAVANGIRVLDMDAQVLSDGSLACFHYDTVDALTTSSGSTSDWHAATFPLLNMDADSWLAPAWPATVHPCLISDVFAAFGRSVLYTIEAKAATVAAVTSLVSIVQKFGFSNQVVIQSTNLASLAPAVTAGIKTAMITDTPSVTSIAAARVTHVVMSTSATDANISAAAASGLVVWVYNCSRHYDYDRVTALGAVGVISDDPVYCGRGAYKRTTDAFSQQTWYPGMIIATGARGVFVSPDRWGFDSQGTRQVLAGFMCPITPTTYTIDFTITWDELAAVNTRYATIHVCAPDDRAYYSNSGSQGYADGYEIRFQQSGTVNVLKTVRSPASSTAVSPTSVAMGTEVLAPGETTSYRVAVSPTAIVVSRTDAGTSGLTYTASDSTYRGGYVHFGKADSVNTLKISFSDVTRA